MSRSKRAALLLAAALLVVPNLSGCFKSSPSTCSAMTSITGLDGKGKGGKSKSKSKGKSKSGGSYDSDDCDD